MTYEQAVRQASRNAMRSGRDWYVTESEEGCAVTDDEGQYASTIYIAEPCAESLIISGLND